MQPSEPLRPFLKWAGGKRWLAASYPHLFPTDYNRYLEPFLGGAAVFFSLRPERSILSDSNERLVECYQAIRNDPATFEKQMRQHQRLHSDEYYYAARDRKFRNLVSRATQFLYLNRTCWNGLYRVNLKGKFNVPKGTKNSVVFEGESFKKYASILAKADIRCCDFERTIRLAKPGDFLFVDPPYTAKHKFNGFIKYNEKIFSWADQVRLRACLETAAKRGVKILICNADHESILHLFGDLGAVETLCRNSILAGEAEYRSAVTEVAIAINYDIPSPKVRDIPASAKPPLEESRA